MVLRPKSLFTWMGRTLSTWGDPPSWGWKIARVCIQSYNPKIPGEVSRGCWRTYECDMNATPADRVTYLVDWVTHLGGLPHLSCKRDQHKVRDPKARRVTPPKEVTSHTWDYQPPCRQAWMFGLLFLKQLIHSRLLDRRQVYRIMCRTYFEAIWQGAT